MPAIENKSATKARAAAGSEPCSAASTPACAGGAAAAVAEHRTKIAIVRGCGRSCFDVGAAGRDGEIGTEAEFTSACVSREKNPPPQLLARKFQENIGGLQKARFGARIARALVEFYERFGASVARACDAVFGIHGRLTLKRGL